MCDYPRSIKETGLPYSLCTINDGARDYKVTRANFLSQRANCREREDCLYTEMFKSGDVGCKRHEAWLVGVIRPMPSDESYVLASGQPRDSYW